MGRRAYIDEQGRVNLSYSTLRDIAGPCSHRWEMQHILNVQPQIENRRLLVPNVLDKALTEWIHADFPQNKLVTMALGRYDQFCENNFVRWRSILDRQEQREYARRSAYELERSMRSAGLCRPGVATSQDRLKIERSSVVLRGQPDLILHDTGEIYDLKTTDNPKWLDVDQLYYYDLLYRGVYNKAPKKVGYLVPVMNPPVLEGETTRENLESIIAKINEGVRRILNKDFQANVSNDNCYMCFLKDACVPYRTHENRTGGLIRGH